MEIHEYLTILRRHLRLLILLPVVAACVAFIATFLLGTSYVADAKIQVLADQIEPGTLKLRTDNSLSEFPVGVRDASDTITKQQTEMLRRRPVAEEVVRRLHLDQPESVTDPIERLRRTLSKAKAVAWDLVRYFDYKEKPPFEGAVDKVQASIIPKPQSGSFIVDVFAKANKPGLAAQIANTAVDVSIEQNRKLAMDLADQKRSYLETQAAAAQQRMAEAQSRLADYRREKGIVAPPDQAKIQAQSAEQLRADLRQVDAEIAATEAQLGPLKEQLGKVAPEVSAKTVTSGATSQQQTSSGSSKQDASSVLTNSSASTRSDGTDNLTSNSTANTDSRSGDSKGSAFTNTVDKREQASVVNGSSSSTSDEQRSPIDTSSSGTSQTSIDSNSSATASSPNPVYQGLQTSLLNAERSLPALNARKAQLESALAEQEAANLDLISQDSQLSELALHASVTAQEYAKISNDLYNAQLDVARPASPVRILEQATAPLYPASPIRGMYVGGALGLGLLVALVLAFLLDYCDLSLRTARQTEQILGMPLLGEVAPLPRGRKASRLN